MSYLKNISHGFLLKIISETSHIPIKTFLQQFEQNRIKFSDCEDQVKI